MQSLNSFPIFLDQSLKIKNKLFFQQLSSYLAQIDMVIIDQQDQPIDFPKLVISSEGSSVESFLKSEDILVELIQENLDFFKADSPHEYRFEIEGFEDFLDLFPLFREYFQQVGEKIEQDFLFDLTKKSQLFFKEGLKGDFFGTDKDLLDGLTQEYIPKNLKAFLQQQIERFMGDGVQILSYVELLKDSGEGHILPLIIYRNRALYLKIRNDVTSKVFYPVLTLFCFFLGRLERKNEDHLRVQNLKNKMEIPIVLIGKDHQILSYNQKFSDLNIPRNELEKIRSHDQRVILGVNYRVIEHTDSMNIRELIFFPVDDDLEKSKKPKNQELGIISSSLAHELNNPLGGILAAIGVLQLDYDSIEEREILNEMKLGVDRCKNLVETFLGFSKVGFNQQGVRDLNLPIILEQSLSLVRFRLVENNISFVPRLEKKSLFQSTGNPYVLSMIFYLIWSEMITSLSHIQLVKRSDGPISLSLEVLETEKSILINFDKDIKIPNEFMNSKLILHLLELARVSILCEEGQFKVKSL